MEVVKKKNFKRGNLKMGCQPELSSQLVLNGRTVLSFDWQKRFVWENDNINTLIFVFFEKFSPKIFFLFAIFSVLNLQILILFFFFSIYIHHWICEPSSVYAIIICNVLS